MIFPIAPSWNWVRFVDCSLCETDEENMEVALLFGNHRCGYEGRSQWPLTLQNWLQTWFAKNDSLRWWYFIINKRNENNERERERNESLNWVILRLTRKKFQIKRNSNNNENIRHMKTYMPFSAKSVGPYDRARLQIATSVSSNRDLPFRKRRLSRYRPCRSHTISCPLDAW